MGSARKLNGDMDNVVALVKKGDEAAFGLLYDRYAGSLFQFINSRIHNKEATEEIIQETFISAWNNRETLQIDTLVEPYLLDIAKNKILAYVRTGPVIQKYASEFTRLIGDDSSANETRDREMPGGKEKY